MTTRKYRWTLVIILSVLCAGSVIVAIRMHSHDMAVARVRSLGGVCTFESKSYLLDYIRLGLGSRWSDYIANASVELKGASVTDADLQFISSRLCIARLSLEQCNVSHESLAGLQCTTVSLVNVPISDDGVDELLKSGTAQSVVLDRTAMSDFGIRRLAGLRTLRQLWLYGDQITDSTLLAIPVENTIEELVVWRAALSEKGISSLSRWRNLSSLECYDCGVDRRDVAELLKVRPTLDVRVDKDRLGHQGVGGGIW